MFYSCYHHRAGIEVPYLRCSSKSSHLRISHTSWDLTLCNQHSYELSMTHLYSRCFLCQASNLFRTARTPSDSLCTFHMSQSCKSSRSIRGPTSPNSDPRDTYHTGRCQRCCNHHIVVSCRLYPHTTPSLC